MDNTTCKHHGDVCLKNATLFDNAVSGDTVGDFLKGAGYLFYIAHPNQTSYRDYNDVPNYYTNAWLYFLLFMLLENVILCLEKKPTYRLNDTLTSISHGVIQETGRLVFRGAECWTYVFLHQNFHLIKLPWNYYSTWCLAAVGVDFCYYWLHRACHEVHILWAQHQVHHSSEEFNLPVGLRQSILQGWCGFLFYLPLALAIPPAQFIAHQHLNMLFQFWIHTDTVRNLGPLEYIFNTPSHHRVHHGCTLYCLDKNYGGVLIIWDRIFGTFQAEKHEEEIVYGLVVGQPSFNLLHLQTFYTAYVLKKLHEMTNFGDKLRTIFYGPSWLPGSPRLGLDKDKIEVKRREKYDVAVPLWRKVYVLVHFPFVLFVFHGLMEKREDMSLPAVITSATFILASLICLGLMFDRHPQIATFELLRCILFTLVVAFVVPANVLFHAQILFGCSALLWCCCLYLKKWIRC